MSATDYATIAVAVMTILGGFVGAVRWLVKHYLSELKNNGGSSVKDQVERLEARVDQIYILLCERDKQKIKRFTSCIWHIILLFTDSKRSKYWSGNDHLR